MANVKRNGYFSRTSVKKLLLDKKPHYCKRLSNRIEDDFSQYLEQYVEDFMQNVGIIMELSKQKTMTSNILLKASKLKNK